MEYYTYHDDQIIYYDLDEVTFPVNDISFSEIWENCIYPSLIQLVEFVKNIFVWNLLFRLLWIFVQRLGYHSMIHIFGILCGNFCLLNTVKDSVVYIVVFSFISYVIIKVFSCVTTNKIGYILGIISIVTLGGCEVMQGNAKTWHEIRGIQMIATMKAVSLAFDLDAKRLRQVPNIFAFMGYIFCPANCILGPWIPFEEYIKVEQRSKLNIKWIVHVLVNSSLAVFFLLMSNCLIPMVISNHSWKWIVAYRDALSFRCSHYFISYLSQSAMALSGLTNLASTVSPMFGLQVTRFHMIEFPRSLVQTVVNWNIPMHRWLKKYVFRIIKPYDTLLAIFSTYFISALLHGLNMQIGAVLLALAFYTYVEYNLRLKIAEYMNGCVLATPCKSCHHRKKWDSVGVLLVNGIFTLLTICHLSYLGMTFEAAVSVQEEGYSLLHVITKWRQLNFTSHWIILFSYVCYIIFP